MDPLHLAEWLLGLVATPAAAPIAVLSLLVNIYLWRSLQAVNRDLVQSKAQEIERLRGEIERTRSVDNQVMKEMTGLFKMLHERSANIRRGRIDHEPD